MKGQKLSLLIVFFLSLNRLAIAAPTITPQSIPSSTEPGVISNQLSAPPITAPPRYASAVKRPPENNAGALGPAANKIKFKLTRIILEGNKTYTDAQLEALYKAQINKTISVADLEGIVQSITNYYRNNGYILTRAVLPPQHVANGVVHIRVLEGFISKVHVQGHPKRSEYLIQAYGNRIAASRPLQIDVMEHYLRLTNEIPGLSARAVLEPSKQVTASSDMDIIAEQKTMNGYLSYDNYGTRYIGPNQVTANLTANSIFQSGDSTHLTTVRTSRPLELQYFDFSHDFPIGCRGLRASLGANTSRTMPGLNLRPLKISGDATNFYGTLQYPIIRARDSDLTIDGGVNYIDSGVNTFDSTLYNDHIRSFKFGANYDITDRFKGSNLMSAHIEQGLAHFLGASSNPTSPFVSRFGADGHYTKINANVGRLQQIYSRFSTFIYATGQYSFNPLLSTAQFAFGGSQLGRGYDPAEIIGDRGFAGSIELRMDNAPGWFWLQTLQPYLFYDAGVIYNMKDVIGTKQKQSCTSTGVGMRIVFTQHFTGNLIFAQPLTKEVVAEEIVGHGRKPRGFFSIVASL